MAERHRLAALEVRVAGHQRVGLGLGEREHDERERLDLLARLARRRRARRAGTPPRPGRCASARRGSCGRASPSSRSIARVDVLVARRGSPPGSWAISASRASASASSVVREQPGRVQPLRVLGRSPRSRTGGAPRRPRGGTPTRRDRVSRRPGPTRASSRCSRRRGRRTSSACELLRPSSRPSRGDEDRVVAGERARRSTDGCPRRSPARARSRSPRASSRRRGRRSPPRRRWRSAASRRRSRAADRRRPSREAA